MSKEKAAEIIELNPPRAADGDPPMVEAKAPAEFADPVGVILSKARRKAGFSRLAVSEATKIKEHLVAALEDGELDKLPSTPFAAGFVKSYAQFLDLDPDVLSQQFRDEIAALAPVAEEPVAQIAIPPSYASDGARIVSLAGIAAIVLFAIWITVQVVSPKKPQDSGRVQASAPRVTVGPAPAAATIAAPAEAMAQPEAPDSAATEPSRQEFTVAAPELPAGPQTEPVSPAEQSTPETAATDDALTNFAENNASEPMIVAEQIGAGILEETASDAEAVLPSVFIDAQPAAASAPSQSIDDTILASILDDPALVDDRAEIFDAARPEIGAGAAAPQAKRILVTADPASEILVASAQPAIQTPVTQRAPAPQPAAKTENIVAARLKRGSPPKYPSRCERRADPHESVALVFDVTASGRAANIRVASSTNRCFNDAAVKSVSRWRFNPRTVNGAPRPQTGKTATVNFDG